MKKFEYDHTDYSAYTREQTEGWEEVRKALLEMPPLPLGDDLVIWVIPPFGALVARFRIGKKGDGTSARVSVYLDTAERAGFYDDQVYWEIHPGEEGDDVSRYALEDIDGMFKGIRESLRLSIEGAKA